MLYQQINWPELGRILQQVRPGLLLAGLSAYILALLPAAGRWIGLIELSGGRRGRRGYLLRHFWIGLAVGFVLPGGLGWDAYRVTAASRLNGNYSVQTGIVVFEKIFFLLLCAGLILLCGLWLPLPQEPEARFIFRAAQGGTLICGLLVIAGSGWLLAPLKESGPGRRLPEWLPPPWRYFLVREHQELLALKTGLGYRHMAAAGLLTAACSGLVLLLNAFGSWLIFLALRQPLSFAVHLYVTPIMMFLLALPISFATLGIREGSFVLLYGFFAVSGETALTAAFCSLLTFWLNIAVGALLLWLEQPATT